MNERLKEIEAIPRKELNSHCLLLEQEQEEYQKELHLLRSTIKSLQAERDRYREALEQSESDLISGKPREALSIIREAIAQSALREE